MKTGKNIVMVMMVAFIVQPIPMAVVRAKMVKSNVGLTMITQVRSMFNGIRTLFKFHFSILHAYVQ